MSINSVGSSLAQPKIKQENQDESSIEQRIKQLQEKLNQVKENDKLTPDEKEKRILNIEKQLERLEAQKDEASSIEVPADIKQRFDTYEPQPETQAAGLYKVSRDEEGHPIVQFDKFQEDGASEKAQKEPKNEGEKPIIVKTTGNTDKVDQEIDKLKQAQSDLKQQISSATDSKEKEALEASLALIEAEVKMKDNDTYRRQHMEITEQKVVSRIGD